MKETKHPNLYEELSIGQIIHRDTPRIESSLRSQLADLKTPSLKCLNHFVQCYVEKQKMSIRARQEKHLQNAVKSVHAGLLTYSRNEKSAFADIFDKPCRFQNHDNLDSKPLRNREINLDRKYNVPLSIKYATLKEAESIAQQKKASEQNQCRPSLQRQPLIEKMRFIHRAQVSPTQQVEKNPFQNRILKQANNLFKTSFLDIRNPSPKRKFRNTENRQSNSINYNNLSFHGNSETLVQPHSHFTLSKKKKPPTIITFEAPRQMRQREIRTQQGQHRRNHS